MSFALERFKKSWIEQRVRSRMLLLIQQKLLGVFLEINEICAHARTVRLFRPRNGLGTRLCLMWSVGQCTIRPIRFSADILSRNLKRGSVYHSANLFSADIPGVCMW